MRKGFGGEAYLIQCRTCHDNQYGWRYYGNGGCPMNPTVVLWSDRRKAKLPCPPGMQVFSEPRDAAEFARMG